MGGEGETLGFCSTHLQGFVCLAAVGRWGWEDPVHTARRNLISVNWPPSLKFSPVFHQKKRRGTF